MSLELARLRLRGAYAIAAGVLLLIGIPMLEGALLAPLGYTAASSTAVEHGDFGPLLLWVSQHTTTYAAFHIVELAVFLLVIPLPVALRTMLYPGVKAGGRVFRLLGQAGFALDAVAVLFGLVGAVQAGAQYAAARTPQAREAVASGYLSSFALQNLFGAVLAGLLIALWLLMVALRIIRTGVIPRWLGLASFIPAAVLGATALQFLAGLAQVGVPLSPFALPLLALWLICCGIVLMRVREIVWLERDTDQPAHKAPQPSGE
jgi:hypothetical protein